MPEENFELSSTYDKLDHQIELPQPLVPKFFTHLNDIRITQNRRKSKIYTIKKTQRKNLTVRFHHNNDHLKQQLHKQKIADLEQITLPKAKALGKLMDGKLHGYCQVTYNDGSVFRGQYHLGAKISGQFKFYDNTQYEGEFLNQNFHGQGKFTFQSGKVIEGRWNLSKIEGNAKIIYPNGDIYYGEVIDLKKNGNGCLYFSNNTKYIGQFRNGYIQGNGCFYRGDNLMLQGQWEKGKLVKKSQQIS